MTISVELSFASLPCCIWVAESKLFQGLLRIFFCCWNIFFFMAQWWEDMIMSLIMKKAYFKGSTASDTETESFSSAAADLNGSLCLRSTVGLWLTPIKLLSCWPFTVPKGSKCYTLLHPQLSVCTYHACLTGGSCPAVCNKRLKYWTGLSLTHNRYTASEPTLGPSPFVLFRRSALNSNETQYYMCHLVWLTLWDVFASFSAIRWRWV